MSSSDGDFKVIGINDEGTESRHGGDDLDKIARILNGEDLDVTIIIDNDWIFNSSKLILHDSSGNKNKITIATSSETADWIITIPTLGGNQTPVFEDLEQTLTNKTLDDVTLTGTVTLPSAASTFLEFIKPHTDGAKEMLAKWRLDEVSTSYLSIENANSDNDVFVPSFWFKQLESEALQSGFFLGMIGDTKDTGTVPIFVIDCRTDASNSITTRPLFAVQNRGVAEYGFGPSSADFHDNELINAAIDGSDNTITNIPDSALSDNVPLLDEANTFTALQKIEIDDTTQLTLYKPINTQFTTWGLDFNAKDSYGEEATYAKIFTSLEDATSNSKDSYIGFSYNIGNAFSRRFYVGGSGIGIGESGATAFISNSGLTGNRDYTFPDKSGKLVVDNHANVFNNVQKISHTTEDILTLYRESGTTYHRNTVKFNLDNSESEETTYAAIKSVIVDNTDGEEDGQIEIHTMKAGTLTRNFTINHLGNFFIGSNGWLVLSPSGLSQQRIFTFPDKSGTLALQGSLGALGDLTDVDTSSSAPSNGDVLTWNESDSEWVPAAPPGASGGEANTGANVGEGDGEIFKSKVSTTLNFRTLAAGTNISISTDTDEVTIDGTHNHDSDYAAISHTHSSSDITSGTLAVARGGTGKSTITENALLVGGAGNSYSEITIGSNNQVLAVDSGSPAWKSLNSELTGTATGDGNGSSVEFIIPHDLGTVPSSHFIQCYSHSIPFTWEIDEEDFTVTFDEAPENGTGNVKFVWRVVA